MNKHPGFIMKILFIVNSKKEKHGKFIIPPWMQSIVKYLEYKKIKVRLLKLESNASIKTIIANHKLIKNKIKRGNYDIVHAQFGGLTSFITALAVGNKSDFMVSFCGTDLLGEPYSTYKYKLKGKLLVLFSYLSAYMAKIIIVKSENLYRALPNQTKKKARIVPNGIDTDFFKPILKSIARKYLGWGNEKKICLFILRVGKESVLGRVKNYPLAKKAVFIASGMDDSIIMKVAMNETHERISYMLNAADCLLLTSFHEGSPNIIKEAMACNTPVVSVNVGDVKDRLRNVDNSFVANSYNSKELAELINKIDDNKRSNGREQLFKQHLDIESIIVRYYQIYQSLNYKIN